MNNIDRPLFPRMPQHNNQQAVSNANHNLNTSFGYHSKRGGRGWRPPFNIQFLFNLISQILSQLQNNHGPNGPIGNPGPGGTPQPVYGAPIPKDPPVIQPVYGAPVPKDPPVAQPVYGAPIPKEPPVIQPVYGAPIPKDPPAIQPIYGAPITKDD